MNSVEPAKPGGTVNIPWNKTGVIRVSIRLARNYAVFYGNDVNPNVTYTILNPRLHFMTTQEGSSNPVIMRLKYGFSQELNSQLANISTKVPYICSAVSCSFHEVARDKTALYNDVETEVPPNISRIQWLFNDSLNYIKYQVDDRQQIISDYLNSWRDDRQNNSVTLANLKANDGFGIGVDFGKMLDLRNQKLNLDIKSEISNTKPYNIYLYFHAMREL